MRATPLGQPPHRARAALPDLPRITGAGLLPLRRDHALWNLPHDRATLVPDLPTPLSAMLELRPTRSDHSGTLTRPLCADCTPPPSWLDCPTCSDPDHPKPGRCERCLINRRLDEIMGPATADLAPGLLALRHDIATAEHSITANRWLTKQPVASVLADLAAGRMPLTHEALDKLPKRQILEHLRLTLVAVGALPERDEELIRLERALTDFLATQQDPARRKVLHRYLIWNLLRRLRSRNNGRPTTRQQALRIRLHRRAAEAFLGWLDTHNLTLATFGQTDLEHWLTDPAGGYRYETGHVHPMGTHQQAHHRLPARPTLARPGQPDRR